MREMRYSEFIHGLQLAQIALDRKSLSETAIHDPATFDKLVEIAKTAVTSSRKTPVAKG
jgi:large subunit ribosomal protein L20